LPQGLAECPSFWNELEVRGVVHPGRHAPAAYPFERLIEGCLSHEQPSLFWEQLLGYRVYGLAASPSRGAAEFSGCHSPLWQPSFLEQIG